jgi:plasmid maintenance system antidote protein VapI
MFNQVVHPGGVLKDELDELRITPTEFARQIDVPANRIRPIIADKRSIRRHGVAAQPLARHRSAVLAKPSGAI